MVRGSGDKASISFLAGSVIQVISGINFYLYFKAARQFASFHICLERTNRFLVANSICMDVGCTVKRDEIRTELIEIIARAPMFDG